MTFADIKRHHRSQDRSFRAAARHATTAQEEALANQLLYQALEVDDTVHVEDVDADGYITAKVRGGFFAPPDEVWFRLPPEHLGKLLTIHRHARMRIQGTARWHPADDVATIYDSEGCGVAHFTLDLKNCQLL